jgi:soluble lytic murein transglycosylase-like protein
MMKKLLSFTAKRVAVSFSFVALIAIVSSILFSFGGNGADPSDDFSLSVKSARLQAFLVMTDQAVARILEERVEGVPSQRIPHLARHLVHLCNQYQFDPAFVLSLIEVESGFRPRAVSPAGAVGLMQLMPATARAIVETLGKDRFNNYSESYLKARGGYRGLLKDPFINLEFGMAYLAWLRDRYESLSPYYLVAAYNVGPSKMDELLSRKDFKPVMTQRYYESIRRLLPKMRSYHRMGSAGLEIRRI